MGFPAAVPGASWHAVLSLAASAAATDREPSLAEPVEVFCRRHGGHACHQTPGQRFCHAHPVPIVKTQWRKGQDFTSLKYILRRESLWVDVFLKREHYEESRLGSLDANVRPLPPIIG